MGSNGLKPALNEKCPDAPSKAKYLSSDAAWTAANKRSVETGIDIVAYACPGCGYFHLTKKVTGSDVVVKADVGITIGALRKISAPMVMDFPERVLPLVPGNREARQKILEEYLKDKEAVTGADVLNVLGLKSTSGVGPYMRRAGWEVSSHGRGAYWLRSGGSKHEKVADMLLAKREARSVEASIARHPSAQDAGWRPVDVTSLPPNATIEDLFGIYKAAGLTLRLQITDHTNGSGA